MKTTSYTHRNGTLKTGQAPRWFPSFCPAISAAITRKSAADSLRDARKKGLKLARTV